MRYETSETIRQLEGADWFSRVGQHDSELAIFLASWEEAVQECSSEEWKNLKLQLANRFRERLLARSRERFSEWNDIVDEMKVLTIPLVRQKVSRVIDTHSLPKAFQDAVEWDILHLFMEAEYVDVCPPG